MMNVWHKVTSITKYFQENFGILEYLPLHGVGRICNKILQLNSEKKLEIYFKTLLCNSL